MQQGHSGGGLFNENWELVGLIKQDQPPNAVAIRIEAVIDQLKQWGYTVALSRAPVTTTTTTTTTTPRLPAGATSLVAGGDAAPAVTATGIAEVRRMHDRDAWGDSLPLLKRLIDEQPKSPELLALRSHAHSHLERPSEALADGHEAVKLGPTVAETYLRRGEAYSAQGKHQLAIADYDQAIKLNPKEDEAFANRAAALAGAGQNEKALESANRALAMRTDRYEYWFVRGEIHGLLKNPKAAIEDLTQAIKLRPQRAMLYLVRANMHIEAKQYQPALQDLDEALRIAPNDPDTLAARGMLHSHIGNIEAAKADLSYALRLRPGHKEWTAFLQRIEASNSSSGKGAGASTAGAPASAPPPPGGYARLVDDAVAAVRAQRTAEASELVDQMIRLDASRSEGWSLRGSLAMHAVRQPARGLRGLRERARARRRDLLPPRPRSRAGTAEVPRHAHHHRRLRGVCGRHGRTSLQLAARHDPRGRDQPGLRLGARDVPHQVAAAGHPVADLQLLCHPPVGPADREPPSRRRDAARLHQSSAGGAPALAAPQAISVERTETDDTQTSGANTGGRG